MWREACHLELLERPHVLRSMRTVDFPPQDSEISSQALKAFPHIPPHLNHLLDGEKAKWDFVFLRPVLLVLYFFFRCLAFPFKFLFHRRPWGFEGRLIDATLAFGIRWLARPEAVELLVRHIQIEPLLYRHLLHGQPPANLAAERKLNGIDGDYHLDSLQTVVRHNMTIGHDELTWEYSERFDKELFLEHLDDIRRRRPEDHEALSKEVLEINRRDSLCWLGPTNVIMTVVFVITIFADLRTAVKALNSFGSDTIALWALKQLYREHPDILTDLEFYLPSENNRSHHHSSAFFSDPALYLHTHIVFDEYAYHILRHRPPLFTAT